MSSARRALVVGTGLIGGSVGLALRAQGWHVTGRDVDESRAARAVELGALDEVGDDVEVDITFVATPVGSVPAEVRRALRGRGVVTDVAGVKAPIVTAVADARFVGGHPMAGSEQEGVDGADASLFEGATWVLTPTDDTDPAAYAQIRAVVSSLGADVVALRPEDHDQLVALVSHVPHLAAAALMTTAAAGAEEHAAVLRLAAGGFRDMTRVAAGHPGIWIDICAENRDAIVTGIEGLQSALSEMRELVERGDRERLLAWLQRARAARVNLPTTAPRPEELAEIRVAVPDRPGVIAEVTTLVSELGVNMFDLETVHSAEGGGVFVFLVDAASGDLVRGALLARHYRPSARRLA
ncbi:MAG: prephenate dehydrogenase/arogenate dehydrogenase family protein [Acidimicrobiia bacterium]|nr:prephenate dehydrogenase/arogenate dehydrogenase family protein [Acidimicrobiia bacterium]